MAKKNPVRKIQAPNSPSRAVQGIPIQTARLQSAEWKGPLPPPQALQAFGDIDQSFPERIMRMAEQAAEHQRFMETEAMRQQNDDLVGARSSKSRGQWFAAVLAVFFGLVGGIVCYLGHPGAGATIITGTVVSLAAVFVIGRATGNGQG